MATMPLFLAILHLVLVSGCLAGGGTPWATPDQEALDELQDIELFKAVVTSMAEWHKKHDSHRQKRAESSVCYKDLGCFYDSGPFGYLDMLPSPPEEVGTRFLLYNGRARGNIPVMDVPFGNLSSVWSWAGKAFNVSAPTKVIVHGFGGSCGHVWVYEMRSALLTVEDCNVICVDWENGAVIPNYVRAAANTRLVGKQLSMLLAGLATHVGLRFETVHVIGFSLGAHVAGFAGAELKNLSRITGLDPAAPLFESQDPRARLDSSDAMFVDVIHSNGENLILGGLGSWQPMGHVDFYPNGGRMQKGCTNLFVGAVSDILWSASDVEGRSLCNHRRAYKFFTDSVSPRCHFPAFPCESYDKFLEGDCFPCTAERRCGNMGYYADRSNGRGSLYLVTREEEPFCAHQYHVRVESSPSSVPVTSYGKMQLTLIGTSELNETFTLTQKDDEELKMGTALGRITVPHPVMQEPRSVQVMYTAYSGWISSGLSNWSIDKVALTDSFGKSMSVCKKGLILESGVPMSLPLYPGECNPPRDNPLETSQNWTNTERPAGPVKLHDAKTDSINTDKTIVGLLGFPAYLTSNFTKYVPTPVVHIGDELLEQEKLVKEKEHKLESLKEAGDLLLEKVKANPEQVLEKFPWQPIDILDSGNTNSLDGSISKRENSRAFGTEHAPVFFEESDTKHNDSLDTLLNATATNTTERSVINEPILIPINTSPALALQDTSSTRSSSDVPTEITARPETPTTSEIKEPVLSPKTTEATTVRPSMLKTREIPAASVSRSRNPKWMPAEDLNPPPLGGSPTWEHWLNSSPEASSSISLPLVASPPNDTSTEQPSTTTPKTTKKPNSIMVQLFPQRLAALLAQAEHYARLTLSLPMAAVSKITSYYRGSDKSNADLTTSASTNRFYFLKPQPVGIQNPRQPKQYTTVKPTQSTPEHQMSTTSEAADTKPVIQSRIDLLPHYRAVQRNHNVYVPYTYTSAVDDSSDKQEGTERERFIPLLRNLPSKKQEPSHVQSYANAQSKSASETERSYHKTDDTDYNNYFNIFRYILPRTPER